MTNESISPLPSWIKDHGNNRYTVDIKAAQEAGESIPIQLGNIPQFADFFTSPPIKAGTIDFVNR